MITDDLKAASLKVMVSYQSDLDIDVAEIDKRPGIPFLHYTLETGTYLCFLIPYEMLPKKGETVPFLFSHVDRNKIIDNIAEMTKYYTLPSNAGVCKLVQYSDGLKLRWISMESARKMGADHAAKLRREIDKEKHR